MRIGKKLTLLMGGLVALFMGVVIVALWGFQTMGAAADRAMAEAQATANTTDAGIMSTRLPPTSAFLP